MEHFLQDYRNLKLPSNHVAFKEDDNIDYLSFENIFESFHFKKASLRCGKTIQANLHCFPPETCKSLTQLSRRTLCFHTQLVSMELSI